MTSKNLAVNLNQARRLKEVMNGTKAILTTSKWRYFARVAISVSDGQGGWIALPIPKIGDSVLIDSGSLGMEGGVVWIDPYNRIITFPTSSVTYSSKKTKTEKPDILTNQTMTAWFGNPSTLPATVMRCAGDFALPKSYSFGARIQDIRFTLVEIEMCNNVMFCTELVKPVFGEDGGMLFENTETNIAYKYVIGATSAQDKFYKYVESESEWVAITAQEFYQRTLRVKTVVVETGDLLSSSLTYRGNKKRDVVTPQPLLDSGLIAEGCWRVQSTFIASNGKRYNCLVQDVPNNEQWQSVGGVKKNVLFLQGTSMAENDTENLLKDVTIAQTDTEITLTFSNVPVKQKKLDYRE